MSTNAAIAAPQRASKRFASTPLAAGLPDPRPLTGYDATYEEVDGHSRITIKLEQACIIRVPDWGFVDCTDGSIIKADSFKVDGNATILFDFLGVLSGMVALVEVPYQDMQVQNFQGGFVRPGGQWFRKPG